MGVRLSVHQLIIILLEKYVNRIYPKTKRVPRKLRCTEIIFSFELVGNYLEAVRSLTREEAWGHKPSLFPRKITSRR